MMNEKHHCATRVLTSLTTFFREKKLEQSLAYQQFSTNVDEEESWINEKNTIVASDDYGDTLAAAQVRVESSQGGEKGARVMACFSDSSPFPARRASVKVLLFLCCRVC